MCRLMYMYSYYVPAGACRADTLEDADYFFKTIWYNGTDSKCETTPASVRGWFYLKCECTMGFLRVLSCLSIFLRIELQLTSPSAQVP